MANLNVSNRMVQVLGSQGAQTLVKKILTDSQVDKTDKKDLQELEALLKEAGGADGELDGDEKELIGALTNHSYVLGVNTGTSEAILLANLSKVQEIQERIQKSDSVNPTELSFDGLSITTDGFFNDSVRVVRLRDQIDSTGTAGTADTADTAGTTGTTDTAGTTGTTGPKSELTTSAGKPILTSSQLAEAVSQTSKDAQQNVANFAGYVDNILTYSDQNPNQYPGQTADTSRLKEKLSELRNTQNPDRQLQLLNELNTDVDKIYANTNIKSGAAGIDQDSVLTKLDGLRAQNLTPSEAQAVDFLTQNPELLQSMPNLSEYGDILNSLNPPKILTDSQSQLKTALTQGNVGAVNELYLQEMLGSFSLFSFMGGGKGPNPLPGTWTNASGLAQAIESASPERRTELIAALQSTQAAEVAKTVQSSPLINSVMSQYTNANAAYQSIQALQSSGESMIADSQAAIQNQGVKALAVKTELETVNTTIDDLLKNGDLADPVKKHLIAQKETINKALNLIKTGGFTPEAAAALGSGPTGLDAILASNASRLDSKSPLSLKQALKRDATLASLDELAKNPANLKKMEEAIGKLADKEGNLLYSHAFEKDANGKYKFPGEMSALLKDPSLDSGALDLAMHQVNRSLHVIDSASTRSKITLVANYDQGKKMADQGQGQRDFYSGYMGLQSINSLMSTSQTSGISNAEILNSVSRNGAQAILDNPELDDKQKREQISQLTEQGLEDANKSLVGKVSDEKIKDLKETFQTIFDGNTPSQKIARDRLLAAAHEANPSIDVSKIKSADDLLDQLDESQIAALQSTIRAEASAIAGGEYPQAVRDLTRRLTPGVFYQPGMDVSGLSDIDKKIVAQADMALQGARQSSQIMMAAVTKLEPLAEFRSAQADLAGRLQEAIETMQSVQGDAKKDLPTPASTAIFGTMVPPVPGSENYLKQLEDYNKDLVTKAKNYLTSTDFVALSSDEQIRVTALVESVKTSATAILTQAPLIHQVKSGLGLSPEQQNAATTALGLSIAYRDAAKKMGTANTPGQVEIEQVQLDITVEAIHASGKSGKLVPPVGASSSTLAVYNTMTQFHTGMANYNTAQKIVSDAVGEEGLMDEDYQKFYSQHGVLPDAPQGISVQEVIDNFQGTHNLLVDSPPSVAQSAAQTMLPLLEKQVHGWDEAIESFDNFAIAMDPVVRQLGHPGLDLSKVDNPPASSLSAASMGGMGATKADQKASELVAKANELADRLVLAPKGADSDSFLNDLVTDFLNIIRDQDYKTRQLVLAQLANQMMTDSITNFYKDKTDKNNKYHQDALASMASSFEQNIQQSIQSSLVAAASGGDAQSVAAVSGQVGAAGTAKAMNVMQLRSSTEQLLSQAQQIEPPLITNQQKDQILNSLFDDNPNNDALGIIALAGLQFAN